MNDPTNARAGQGFLGRLLGGLRARARGRFNGFALGGVTLALAAICLVPNLALGASLTVSSTDVDSWDPTHVDATVGDDVTWDMTTGTHDVVITDFTDPQNPVPVATSDDEVYTRTFNQAGEYTYICEFHPGMDGTLTVDSGGPSDTTAPTSQAALNPASPGPGGTYDVSVEVTLSATDNVGGSGVASTEYKLDGGSFGAYSTPFTVSADGAHTVEYRSTDSAGNVESTKSVSFSIDTAAPAEITFGKVKRDSKKGTATLEVNSSVAGELELTGDKVATETKQTSGGKTKMPVKATGDAAKTLKKKGKVTVTVEVTLTPTDGDPVSDSLDVKLTKKDGH